jgi:type IV pilus assembly protein PilC
MTTIERRPALASLAPLDGENDDAARLPRLERVPPQAAVAPVADELTAHVAHVSVGAVAPSDRQRTLRTLTKRRPAANGPSDGETASSTKRSGTGRVPAGVLIVFSRQLASFLEAGIPVLEALDVVGSESTSDRMRAVAADMRDTVMRGGSFSDATARHAAVFPGWYRAMVRSAEFTGRLDEVLEQLAVYLERDQQARRQVKSALTYPTFVLVVASVAMVVMSIFVLPKFAAMYDKLGATLPLPTRILLNWTQFVSAGWPFLLGGAVTTALGWTLVFGSTGPGKRRRDRLAMRTPVIGPIFHLVCVERFCRVLAALSAAGVPLPDGIEMSADSTNNTVFQDRMATVREALVRGEGLSRPLTEVDLIPTAGMQMLRVGERTGNLSVQLSKAAAFFEREVAFRMKRATDLFQPAVIVLVGLLIGFVAVAQVAALYSVFGQVNQ